MEDCWHKFPEKRLKKEDKNKDAPKTLVALVTKHTSSDLEDQIWFGDTAATYHVTNDSSGLFNTMPVEESVSVGQGC